jgi:hypothetical protein
MRRFDFPCIRNTLIINHFQNALHGPGKRWMRLFGIGAGVGAGFGLGVSECRASFNRATRYDPNRVLVVPQGTKVNHADGTPKH